MKLGIQDTFTLNWIRETLDVNRIFPIKWRKSLQFIPVGSSKQKCHCLKRYAISKSQYRIPFEFSFTKATNRKTSKTFHFTHYQNSFKAVWAHRILYAPRPRLWNTRFRWSLSKHHIHLICPVLFSFVAQVEGATSWKEIPVDLGIKENATKELETFIDAWKIGSSVRTCMLLQINYILKEIK